MTEPRQLAVSVEQAAELIGIGPTVAWSLVGQGKLPVVRFGEKGGKVRVPLRALDEWLTQRALASVENEDDRPHHLRPVVEEEAHAPRRRPRTA